MKIQRLCAGWLIVFAANNSMAVTRLEELTSRSSIDYLLNAMNSAESWQQARMKLENLGVNPQKILIEELLNNLEWFVETTLQGHSDFVNSAIYSPDGTEIVTASRDRTARIWDAQTGQLLQTLWGHTDQVNSATYSPDGGQIVTASSDRTARIWDVQTGQLLHTLRGHTDAVRSAIYSPDGGQIVTASDDRTARIWDAQTGQLLHTLGGHADPVYSAYYSPDGTQIITAFQGVTAGIWDAQTGQLLHTLEGHAARVRLAAYSLADRSPDGTQIVVASRDQTVRILRKVFIDPGTDDSVQQTLEQILFQAKLYQLSTQLPLPSSNPPHDLSYLGDIWQSLSTRARQVLAWKYSSLNLSVAFGVAPVSTWMRLVKKLRPAG